MSTCTFFGHKDAPDMIRDNLCSVLVYLIEKQNVRKFYVGNQGRFDHMVRETLIELSNNYQVTYLVVLAYMPCVDSFLIEKEDNMILPEGIENVPKRFAIDWRNRWMLQRSKFVVTYVKHSLGGAGKFKELAEKQNKQVFNLAEE